MVAIQRHVLTGDVAVSLPHVFLMASYKLDLHLRPEDVGALLSTELNLVVDKPLDVPEIFMAAAHYGVPSDIRSLDCIVDKLFSRVGNLDEGYLAKLYLAWAQLPEHVVCNDSVALMREQLGGASERGATVVLAGDLLRLLGTGREADKRDVGRLRKRVTAGLHHLSGDTCARLTCALELAGCKVPAGELEAMADRVASDVGVMPSLQRRMEIALQGMGYAQGVELLS